MTEVELLILAAAMSVAYMIAANRLTKIAHRSRMEMADLGSRLLSDPGTSEDFARRVEFRLDTAYSAAVSWRLVYLFPVAAFAGLLDKILGRDEPDVTAAVPAHRRRDFERLQLLHTVSVLANSPAATFLLLVEAAVFGLLFFPMGRAMSELAKLLASDPFGHDHKHG